MASSVVITCRDILGDNRNLIELIGRTNWQIETQSASTQVRHVFEFSLCQNSSSLCSSRDGVGVCKLTSSPTSHLTRPTVIGFLSTLRSFRTDDGFLLNMTGDSCSSTGNYSAQISFRCGKTLGAPRLIDQPDNEDQCRFNFDWEINNTSARLDSPVITNNTVSQGCVLFNRLHNYTFNLTSLYRNNDPYQIRTKDYDYYLNLCAPKTLGLNVSAYRQNLKTNERFVFGYYSNMTLSHLASHLLLNYEGEECHDGTAGRRSVLIVFECSPFQDLDPTVAEEEECVLTIRWPVKSACVFRGSQIESTFTNNTCSVYYDNHLYDLSPLIHLTDSWQVHNGSMVYEMNVCQGVRPETTVSVMCPLNASICRLNSTSNKVTVLAYVNQSYLSVNHDANSIELVFNNTLLNCLDQKGKKFPTVSFIQFTCGRTMIGRAIATSPSALFKYRPAYLMNQPDECLNTFEWRTSFACKNFSHQLSSVNVSQDGWIVEDQEKRFNLSSIFLNSTGFSDLWDSKSDVSQHNNYYINFRGLNETVTECHEALLCQTDSNRTRFKDIGSSIEYYALDSYSKTLEISMIAKKNECGESKEPARSTIRLYCDSTPGLSGFKFESQMNECSFLFDWPTSQLCSYQNQSSLTTKATTTTTQPISSSSSSPSQGYVTKSLPSIVIVFLILVSLILFVVAMNNHEKIARWSMWATMSSCWRVFGQIEWFGRVRRRRAAPARPSLRNRKYGVRYSKINQDGESEVTTLFDEEEDSDTSPDRTSEATKSRSNMISKSRRNDKKTVVSNGSSGFVIDDDFDEQMATMSESLQVKERADSINNMLYSAESDDDLIDI